MNTLMVGAPTTRPTGINNRYSTREYKQSFYGNLNFGNSVLESDVFVMAKGTVNNIFSKLTNINLVQIIHDHFSEER